MQYTVIAADGQRYGPVDVATLNLWATDNRLTPSTILEGPDGLRLQASTVPGIVFPAPPTAVGTYSNPGYQGPGTGPMGAPGYGPASGVPGYAPYPHQVGMHQDNGQGDVTNGWIGGALGLTCCPIIGSIVGIVYGNKASAKGHPQGRTVVIFSIVTLILRVGLGVTLRSPWLF